MRDLPGHSHRRSALWRGDEVSRNVEGHVVAFGEPDGVAVVEAEREDYPGNCSEGLDFGVDSGGVDRINHPYASVMHECR